MLNPANIIAVLLTVITRHICRTPFRQDYLPRTNRVGRSISRASLTMGLISIIHFVFRNGHKLNSSFRWLQQKIASHINRCIAVNNPLKRICCDNTLEVVSVASGKNDNENSHFNNERLRAHKQKTLDIRKVTRRYSRARSGRLRELSSTPKRNTRRSRNNKREKPK